MKKFFILFLFCCTGTLITHAQEINLTDVQAPENTPFAKPFEMQYQLSHTPGYNVSLDEKSFSPNFEIIQTDFTQLSPGTGTYHFTVVPFTLGKSTFTVTFLLTQDGKSVAQKDNEIPVQISPVKTFKEKSLREIRPARVPPSWLTWLLGILLVITVLFTILYFAKRHQKDKLSIFQKEDKRPCHEIALSKIDILLNSGLWERQEYKIFYFTLTDILREYLWRRFQTDTSADTSTELLHRVKDISELQSLLTGLKAFLSSGDLVKFAKAIPTEQERNNDIQLLREIIVKTTPQEPSLQEPKI